MFGLNREEEPAAAPTVVPQSSPVVEKKDNDALAALMAKVDKLTVSLEEQKRENALKESIKKDVELELMRSRVEQLQDEVRRSARLQKKEKVEYFPRTRGRRQKKLAPIPEEPEDLKDIPEVKEPELPVVEREPTPELVQPPLEEATAEEVEEALEELQQVEKEELKEEEPSQQE